MSAMQEGFLWKNSRQCDLSFLALRPYPHANTGSPGFQHLLHSFHELLGFGVRSIWGQILVCYLSGVKL